MDKVRLTVAGLIILGLIYLLFVWLGWWALLVLVLGGAVLALVFLFVLAEHMRP